MSALVSALRAAADLFRSVPDLLAPFRLLDGGTGTLVMGVLKPGTFALRAGTPAHRKVMHEVGENADDGTSMTSLRDTVRYMERINTPPEAGLFPLPAAGDPAVRMVGGKPRRMKVIVHGDTASDHAHPFSVAVAENGVKPSGVREMTIGGTHVFYNMARGGATAPNPPRTHPTLPYPTLPEPPTPTRLYPLLLIHTQPTPLYRGSPIGRCGRPTPRKRATPFAPPPACTSGAATAWRIWSRWTWARCGRR